MSIRRGVNGTKKGGIEFYLSPSPCIKRRKKYHRKKVLHMKMYMYGLRGTYVRGKGLLSLWVYSRLPMGKVISDKVTATQDLLTKKPLT